MIRSPGVFKSPHTGPLPFQYQQMSVNLPPGPQCSFSTGVHGEMTRSTKLTHVEIRPIRGRRELEKPDCIFFSYR